MNSPIANKRKVIARNAKKMMKATFFLNVATLKKPSVLNGRSNSGIKTHSMNKVTMNQAIRKMPRLLWNSFSSVNEAAIPLPGMRIVAYDIQKDP